MFLLDAPAMPPAGWQSGSITQVRLLASDSLVAADENQRKWKWERQPGGAIRMAMPDFRRWIDARETARRSGVGGLGRAGFFGKECP